MRRQSPQRSLKKNASDFFSFQLAQFCPCFEIASRLRKGFYDSTADPCGIVPVPLFHVVE